MRSRGSNENTMVKKHSFYFLILHIWQVQREIHFKTYSHECNHRFIYFVQNLNTLRYKIQLWD